MRVTVDLEEIEIESLKEIERLETFASRREIFLTGLRLLLQLVRARRLGFRPKIVDPKNKKDLDFSWEQLPQLRTVQEARSVSTFNVKLETLRYLISLARELRDLDLERTVAAISQAAWDPAGANGVEDGIIADLIIITLGVNDEKLTCAVRDILTQMTTTFKSFDEMLAQSKHFYRPHFDTRFREQRFLNQEYQREIVRKYPSESDVMRQREVL